MPGHIRGCADHIQSYSLGHASCCHSASAKAQTQARSSRSGVTFLPRSILHFSSYQTSLNGQRLVIRGTYQISSISGKNRINREKNLWYFLAARKRLHSYRSAIRCETMPPILHFSQEKKNNFFWFFFVFLCFFASPLPKISGSFVSESTKSDHQLS